MLGGVPTIPLILVCGLTLLCCRCGSFYLVSGYVSVVHRVRDDSGRGGDARDDQEGRSASATSADAGADAPAAPGQPAHVGGDFLRAAHIHQATGLRSIMRTRAAVTKSASAHIPASDYIPLGTPVTPHVIKLSGTGDYLAIWRLEGITFETADRAEILVRKEALHNFIRALGGGAYALWSHKIRRVVRERLSGQSPNAFCQELHERYEQSFDQHRQMATELYLSVVYRPTPSKVKNFFTRLLHTHV